MVQSYRLPVVNETVRPLSNPSGAVKTMFAVFVGLTALLYLFNLAQGTGVPLMNRLVSNIPVIGDNLNTAQGGPVETF